MNNVPSLLSQGCFRLPQKMKGNFLPNERFHSGETIAIFLYMILINCKVLLYLNYAFLFLVYSFFEIKFQVIYFSNLPQRQ